MKSGSRLERVLAAKLFAVTAELGPPRGADPEDIRKKAAHLRGVVDAANITDNQTAMVRMASWAASILAIQENVEPVYQMVCRDRNRIAMQSDVLGAHALGIRNLLCLSGDHPLIGDHPTTRKVYDIDSIQLICAVKQMRDEGKFLSGEEIATRPTMFIGGAANPFAQPFAFRVLRLAKKIAAGVDFVQTQCIYNMERFRDFVRHANEEGLLDKVYFLAGLTPMKSLNMALYMQKSVPGMDVPEWITQRLAGVEKKKQAEEGIKICCEQIEEMRATKGVAGVHLMAIGWEHRVPEILERAKLLPRPEPPPAPVSDPPPAAPPGGTAP
jgi:methylenetetrahydrofolate reductase (NADPH)